MTAIAPQRSSFSCQRWEYEKPLPGGIVAAVDGSAESIAALNTAAAIARTRRCALHVVTVLPPFPSYHVNPAKSEGEEHVERLRVALKESELRVLVNALEPRSDWTHEVIVGRPARCVSDIAENRAADLIVMGRRKHGVIDRVLGSETTLQVMRMCCVPVFAVSTEIAKPRTIVVATDFSDPSEKAAELAHQLMTTDGTIYLVHVEGPVTTAGESIPDGGRRYPGDVIVWFRRLMNELPPKAGLLVEPVVLSGSPIAAVTEFAERVGADLITAGSHGHNKLERFLLGSVSTGLVREARCGVLIAPQR
jgi:nucleotide-binding universal stress UspA family protein